MTDEEKIQKLRSRKEMIKMDLSSVSSKEAIQALEQKIFDIDVEIRWLSQDHQCSGSGYAHKPHGKCTGYSTDRT